MLISLHCSPSEEQWSIGDVEYPSASAIAQAIPDDVVDVQVTSPGAKPFRVTGLNAAAPALRALVPLALWNGVDDKGKRR